MLFAVGAKPQDIAILPMIISVITDGPLDSAGRTIGVYDARRSA